jgi:hypothetical protein
MKYLEELSYGDSFIYKNDIFLLTSDYNKNYQKLCYNLSSGFSKWIEDKTIIEECPIYRLDKDNNIVAIKERKKDDNY